MELIIISSLVLLFFVLYAWEKSKNIRLIKKHEIEIKESRKEAVKRSRSTIEGQVFEQLVPHFPEWAHTPSEARFLGSPLDFIVFDGMSTGNPKKIIFVEIKTGKSETTPLQNKLKKIIKDKKVEWEIIKIERGDNAGNE